tara:strand:- start:15 stop:1379 length:1365 start_codon:yes stop_codon:yes gene_type:complete
MGYVEVPDKAYYGAQTQRAFQNFPVSDIKIPLDLIYSIAIIKKSAANVNHLLGKLDLKIRDAIVTASDEVIAGKLDDNFILDVFQTGSGTSTNMNVNEVIANRASEILGGKIGEKKPVHPNDHVNMGQSSNDVIPTAINISAKTAIIKKLVPALENISNELSKKVDEFNSIVKIGRTHLQDATPITLGQEFSGYRESVDNGISRLRNTYQSLSQLAQGGTAVGTGINTHPEFGKEIANQISIFTNTDFKESKNHFEAQANQDTSLEVSGALKVVAVSISKMTNDIRLMGTGPRCGLGELILPPVQPGSSIMPGKVNPVICESTLQVCAQVISNDLAITLGAQGGAFELNVMLPLIGYNLIQSIDILTNSINMFNQNLLKDLKVDKQKCESYIEKSLSMCTILVPIIGYDKTAELAYEAYENGKTIRELLLEKDILTKSELKKILDPLNMTFPSK